MLRRPLAAIPVLEMGCGISVQLAPFASVMSTSVDGELRLTGDLGGDNDDA